MIYLIIRTIIHIMIVLIILVPLSDMPCRWDDPFGASMLAILLILCLLFRLYCKVLYVTRHVMLIDVQ